MQTVLITGGTGLIGRALTQALVAKGYAVIVLSRGGAPKKPQPGVAYAAWNVAAQTIDKAAIAKADAIIHLAGANVASGRWTAARKKEIVDSRVQSGALLLKALREIPSKVTAIISASAIGWYGPDPSVPNKKPFVETAAAAVDFLATTCVQWEGSLQPAQAMGKRVVWLRTGIVLSNEGGAYAEFKKPLKAGVAAVLGKGSQVVSWIHITDLVNLYIAALENARWQGPYNAVAPAPVTNETLLKTMAQARGGFHVPAHVPAAVLKLMLGEMSVEVLKSCTVSAQKLEAAGFVFAFPNIGTAVHNLEGSGN